MNRTQALKGNMGDPVKKGGAILCLHRKSDEAIVVKRTDENRKERRASVI